MPDAWHPDVRGSGACAPSPVAINYTCCWLGRTHAMRSANARDRDSRLPKPATRRLIESFVRQMIQRNTLRSALVLLLVSLQVFPASAWVFPEHRDIAALAMQKLDETGKPVCRRFGQRLAPDTSSACVRSRPIRRKQIVFNFAAWAAISGDHSCSAQEMLGTALSAPWVSGVERVSARLKAQLAAASRQSDRTNAVRNSDLALERTDPEYVTRASSNNAHFLLARPGVNMDPEAYVRLALGPTAEVNALATYAWYHLRALDRRVPSPAGWSPLPRTPVPSARRSPMKLSRCTSSRTASRQATSRETGEPQPCARGRTTFIVSTVLR